MIEVTLRDIAEKFELNILTIHHIITKNLIFPEDAANLRSVLFTRSTYCAINYSGHQFTGRYANSASPLQYTSYLAPPVFALFLFLNSKLYGQKFSDLTDIRYSTKYIIKKTKKIMEKDSFYK